MTAWPDRLRTCSARPRRPCRRWKLIRGSCSRRWFPWEKRSWNWPMWCFRPLVAIITAVSEVFGMLPEPVQNFVIILGALLVAFTALTPVIAALAVSFGALNISLLPVIGIIAGGGGGHCRDHRHCEKLGSNHGVVR